MHSVKKLFYLPLLTLFTFSIHAQYKVLFIGNSYTFGRNHNETVEESLPEIFQALATAAGQVTPTVSMRAVSGQDFEYHYKNSQTQIAAEAWTHVILQNQSTQATHIGDISAHMEYGERLYQSILTNNPDTQVLLYLTWARQASHSIITGNSTSSTFATTDEMLQELVSNYHALAEAINLNFPQATPVQVNPVGIAFQSAGGNLAASDPDYLDLFSDGSHANDLGYYLSACVHYSCIYQSSPQGLFESPELSALGLSISPEQASFLETIAWQTVAPAATPDTESPELDAVSFSSAQSLDLSFNEALDPSTALDLNNYTLINRGQRIPIDSVELSSSGQSLRLNFDTEVVGNYALVVNDTLTDLAGNPMLENAVYTGQRSASSILIDFGGSYSVSGLSETWNQASAINDSIRTQVDAGSPYVFKSDLLNAAGQSTGISLSMSDNMLSTNSAGTASGPYPSGATRDSFFGLTGNFGSYTEDGQGVFEFNNCNPEQAYNFRIYTSRIGGSENRETRYTLTGQNSATGDLKISQNVSEILDLGPIYPSATGRITLTVSAGPNNDHSSKFYYLGLIEILTDTTSPQSLYPPVASSAGTFLDWTVEGSLEYCDTLTVDWTPIVPTPTAPYFDTEEREQRFYRLNISQ